MEFNESLIFQVFNFLEDDDLKVDKNLHILRASIFNYSELRASILHSTKDL